MDYTARAVVEAASKTVAVKVDGDKRKDLTKHFKVNAYVTMILLALDGRASRRVVGYQSVAQMRESLAGRALRGQVPSGSLAWLTCDRRLGPSSAELLVTALRRSMPLGSGIAWPDS